MLIAEQKKYTVDDYMILEEGAPFQLINYYLIKSPSTLPLHQIILGRLFNAFTAYIDNSSNGGIAIFAPMDVHFDDGNVFQPDLLFITEDRKDIIKNRIEGSPDLVVEILSPSNAYYDLRAKKTVYEKYGVKEYIIVDPVELSLELLVLEHHTFILKQKVEKTGCLNSQLLQGLAFDLEKLFK